MKYTVAISLLIASAAGMPSLFRRDAVSDAVAQFNGLSDSDKADFLEQISEDGDVNVQGVNKDNSASGNGADVQADVKAVAADDGQANVAVKDSDDVQVTANVQALDDGVVNLNVQGK